jgi:hypothetical protein
MIRWMFTHIHVSRSSHYAVNHLTGDATRRASPDACCPSPHTVWLSAGLPCPTAVRCRPQPNGDCGFSVLLALQRVSYCPRISHGEPRRTHRPRWSARNGQTPPPSGRCIGSAPQVMLADELGLHNPLNIHVVYTRKLGQSITCLSLPMSQ